MLFKNWDYKKKLKLFVNGIEMDFSNNFTASDHPTNFSSMVFHECLPKDKNFYPENLKVQNFAEEFAIGEVFAGDKLIFFGIVNSTGRLNLNPFTPKTKTVEIADFRKWLSIKKPIDLLFFNDYPENMVVTLIEKLNEPKIVVGDLDFTTNELISAYSTFNKSPYQVLKEVIAKQTNSLLYFGINENQQITINYKSNDTLKNNISPIVIDLNNLEQLKQYKILDIEFESNADKYSNVVKIESDNVISNLMHNEKILIEDSETIKLDSVLGKISSNSEDTYFLTPKGEKIKLIILNESIYMKGQYYDLLYNPNRDSVKVNKKYLSLGYFLIIGYFVKRRSAIELFNQPEIDRVANFSKTRGDVFRFEKFNDLTNFNDILKMATANLDIYKSVEKVIYLTAEIPLFEIVDVVEVIADESNVSGFYLVHEITADFIGSSLKNSSVDENNFLLPTFSIMLKSTKNTDNIVNEFDNQSFRDNPAIDQRSAANTTQTINLDCVINIDSSVVNSTLSPLPNTRFNQAKLNYKISGRTFDTTIPIIEVINE